jgi:hypothetical protein
MKRSYALAIVLAVGAPSVLTANTPLPPPRKLTQDFSFTCLMLSEQEPATSLAISIRYELMSEQNSSFRTAYWWALTGGGERFPSNETFMNMRSMEMDDPQSSFGFVAEDGWFYSYTLHYDIDARSFQSVYVPDHLIVRKRLEGTPSTSQLVGIGECRLSKTETAQ